MNDAYATDATTSVEAQESESTRTVIVGGRRVLVNSQQAKAKQSQVRHLTLNVSRSFIDAVSRPPTYLSEWHPEPAEHGQFIPGRPVNAPKEPGLVYGFASRTYETSCIAVKDLNGFLASLTIEEGTDRTYWITGNPWDLMDESPVLNTAGSALRPGRMRVARTSEELGAAPTSWGLYRIFNPDGTIYVGISSNLHNRLGQHRRNGKLDPSSGGYATYAEASHGTTWKQMRDTERRHIQRMRDNGLELQNVAAGGNGRPPEWAMNFGG